MSAVDTFGFQPNDDGTEPHGLSDSDRESVVGALTQEMAELFRGYAAGDVSFEELSFEMYDTLQTLYAIRSGNLTIEYENEFDSDGIGQIPLDDIISRNDAGTSYDPERDNGREDRRGGRQRGN